MISRSGPRVLTVLALVLPLWVISHLGVLLASVFASGRYNPEGFDFGFLDRMRLVAYASSVVSGLVVMALPSGW